MFFYDNDKVRNGEGYILVSDLPVNGKMKFELGVSTQGMPGRLELIPTNVPEEFAQFMPAKEVPITINSVPQGAMIKVDGLEARNDAEDREVPVG